MTPAQRRQLLDNLTQWRRDRLVAEGVMPLNSIDAAVLMQLHHDKLIFGVGVAQVDWQQREKTADDLRWELFPKPGKCGCPR